MRPLHVVIATFFLFHAGLAHASDVSEGFADLVEKLSPAVVNIATTQKIKQQSAGNLPFQFFGPGLENNPQLEPFKEFFDQFNELQKEGQEREVSSLGSGFIIDDKGHVITNNHVIEKAEEIKVLLSNGDSYEAKILGRDPKTDLALLKIETKDDLPYVKLGDSDAMRVGDWVVAIGNPFGLGGSVTKGIISARQRSINAGPYDDFLQTDAPINRGNSGGPLFNLDGDVVGINTAIFSPSGGSVGIGFAIPASMAKNVIAQLKEHGRTFRGWLGVKIQHVTEDVAESVGLKEVKGALVIEVTPGSPATKSDLQPGDIILTFDGKEVEEMRFLPRIVAETKIGKSIQAVYWRDGKKRTTSIKVGELDEEPAELASNDTQDGKKDEASQEVVGMELAELSDGLRKRLGVDKDVQGVLVLQVESDTQAAKKGIRRGDIISEINNKKVTTPKEVKTELEEAKKKGRDFALSKMRRGKEDSFVPVPTSK